MHRTNNSIEASRLPIPAASWMAEPLEPRVLFAATGLIAAGDLAANLMDAPANLSAPRTFMVAATVGKFSLFAGGIPEFSGAYFIDHPTTTVDVYNSATGAWSVSHTPDPIGGGAATTLGNKAIFTTGVLSKKVEIFNAANGKWSTATLPVAAIWKTAATVGSQVILSGKEDTSHYYLAIFNARTGKWRAVTPPAPMQPSYTSARAAGKVLFDDTGHANLFDIYDPQSGLWSTTQQPRVAGLEYGLAVSSMIATTIGSKAIFGMDGGAAVYDGISGIWSSIQYADPSVIPFEGTMLALGSKLLFANAFLRANLGVVDLATGLVSRAQMTNPSNWSAGTVVGTHALFAGGNGGYITAGRPFPSVDFVDNYTDLSPSPVLSGEMTGAANSRNIVTVLNTGDAALPAGYTIQLYATTDRTLGGAILLGSRTVSSSLAAGASSPFNIRTVIPKDMPAGSYHLLAAVQDSSGNITPIAAEEGVFSVRGSRITRAARHSRSHP
jgi:hypothetical protein